MKMLNKKFVRTLSCAAVAVCAAAMLSVGAFAAEVDSTCVEGYLPPQEQMVQVESVRLAECFWQIIFPK